MRGLRVLPSVVAPVQFNAIYHGIEAMVGAPQKRRDHFAKAFSDYIGCSQCYLVSSGRAALYVILNAMSELSARTEVIVPAYTCPSVAVAVRRAGLKPTLCDVSIESLNMDTSHLEDLISERTLCVIATHMFGFPCDIYRICEIADSAGAWVVEDAAQSAGAKYEGYRVGTFGAASLFSLGMGKNFTTGNGGIICVNSPEIEEIIADSVNKLAEPGLVKAFTSRTTLIVYWLLVRSGTFGLVLLLWNHDDDNNDNFPVTRLSGPQSTVGSELLAELDNLNSLRTSNGAFIASALEEVTTIHIPKPIHGADSMYLRELLSNLVFRG